MKQTGKHIIVIGGGFAGLTAATTLASSGHKVTIVEKNEQFGGRARQFEDSGFVFDMGPSWYWMPEVFESYFARFGKKLADYYELIRLDPSYRVFYSQDHIDVPASLEELYELFDSIDLGSAERLRKFLDEAAYKYRVGMEEFVWKPGHSSMDFADLRVLRSLFKLGMLQSITSQINKVTHDDRLRQILAFPVLFLGAKPEDTPALYSLMNYADLVLGTWYPKGGMFEITKAMVALADEMGVEMIPNVSVKRIIVENDEARGVETVGGKIYRADGVIAAADYHHVEQSMLESNYRTYNESYWNRRTMAPSALLYYIGLDRKVEGLKHHNLFFDRDFDQHADEIYTNPKWPSDPLFYICCPSKSDDTVAPDGCENLFVLIPIAPGIENDTEEVRSQYLEMIRKRVIEKVGEDILDGVVVKRSYSVSDFKSDYNAFKGNAYGLANTLRQTAFLKPKMRSKKVKNLYYAGQLTTPGPGVPPSIISGQLAAQELHKTL